MQIRRTLAAGALSTLALAGFASAPAAADTTPEGIDCTTVDAAIETAQDDAKAAQRLYAHSNLGQLIKAGRAEAKAEVRAAGRDLEQAVKELKGADNRAERRQLGKEVKAERRSLAEAERGLQNKSLRAVAEAQREAAKAAVVEAKAYLEALHAYDAASCEDEATEPGTDVEAPEAPETDAPETGDQTGGEATAA